MNVTELNTFLSAVLERELTEFSINDIRSNQYFHGPLNRKTTEELLNEDGQFLVRESCSQRGQYVLSCRHQSTHLHFIVHEHLPKVGDSIDKIRYSFEGPLHDSVRELISFYFDRNDPITISSGAIIKYPVNRNKPFETDSLTHYFKYKCGSTLNDLLEGIDLTKENYGTLLHIKEELLPTSEVTDYIQKLQTGISAIKIEANKSVETELLNLNTYSLIGQTGPNALASHLFRCNLAFIGIDLDDKTTHDQSGLFSSGIELLCLPIGKQIRRDIIIRHECIKYFVVTTILKANDLEHSSCVILTKWILVAIELIASFGDYFGFGAIMAGLCHGKICKQTKLWNQLSLDHPRDAFIFETTLKPQFISLIKGSEPSTSNITFPFVIELCHLIECNYIMNSKLFPLYEDFSISSIIDAEADHHSSLGLENFSLDDILSQINISTKIIDKLEQFETNARLIADGFFFKEPQLERLFQSGFHLRFLFEDENIDIDQLNHEMFQRLEAQLIVPQ